MTTTTAPKHAPATATKRAPVLKTKLRPLGDRVVIQPVPREEMTKSGIVIPDTVKEKPQEGLVLAVGPGRILDDGRREQIDVKRCLSRYALPIPILKLRSLRALCIAQNSPACWK